MDETALLRLLALSCSQTLLIIAHCTLLTSNIPLLPILSLFNPWGCQLGTTELLHDRPLRTYALTFWTPCPGQAEVVSPRFAQGLRALSAFYFVHRPCAPHLCNCALAHLHPGLESAIYVLLCPRTIVPFVCRIVSVVHAIVHNCFSCLSCPLAECAYCGPGKCYSRSKSVVVLDGDCFTCLNSLLVHSLPPVLSVDVKVRLPQCCVSLIHIYHIELNISSVMHV